MKVRIRKKEQAIGCIMEYTIRKSIETIGHIQSDEELLELFLTLFILPEEDVFKYLQDIVDKSDYFFDFLKYKGITKFISPKGDVWNFMHGDWFLTIK